MQDLAPLEELERLRIEFPGMVSYELRAPAVSNFVKKLRRKLGDNPASPAFIQNMRGVGYRMRGC